MNSIILEAQKKIDEQKANNTEEETIEGWEKSFQRIEELRKKEKKEKEAQASSNAEQKQPEAQAQCDSSNIIAGPQTQSSADLRLEAFKQANSKLARNKSQIPNLAVQARIFKPVTPGRRKFFKDWQEISVIGRDDITVEHKFHQLDQADLTAWLMLIKFADSCFVSSFTYYEFIKAMGKKHNSDSYNWLLGPKDKKGRRKGGFLGRIRETQFSITLIGEENRITFSGSLAPYTATQEDKDAKEDKDKNKFAVQLSKPLAAMFGLDHWSYINIEQRLELGNKQWAQAFHAWASTHTCPADGFWWKKEELLKEWGPEYKDASMFIRDFRRRVL